MIVFAGAVAEPDAYRDHARPGIELAAEPGSAVHVIAATTSICRNYNVLLDLAAGTDDLEALVIVDEDTEIADRELCAKLRRAFTDPDVAVVGCAGATGVAGVAWWEGEVVCGDVRRRYSEHGGGELDAFAWARTVRPPAAVDAVGGFLLALSPWAVASLRFDEGLALGIGYDVDLCAQARKAGRKVVVADVGVIQHRSLELVDEPEAWTEAHIRLAGKWDGRLPGAPPRPEDWKQRARLAEAERDAAQTLLFSNYSRREAQLLPLERELKTMTDTFAWRLTEPLRLLNAYRRQRARDGSPPSIGQTPRSRSRA
jgi:Glycosyltransferase like family